VNDVLYGFDAEQRERVAALRAEGRFFWLDVSLSETSSDDLFHALAIPDGALQALPDSADASVTRRFHADGQAVVSRCAAMSNPSRRPTRPRTGFDRSSSRP
jgi:hypothetical protein